jgi:hypothetical protein
LEVALQALDPGELREDLSTSRVIVHACERFAQPRLGRVEVVEVP